MYDPVATLLIATPAPGDALNRTLATLMKDSGLAAFQVVIVCHGCDAARAELARGILPGALVLNTAHAGAWRALNLGMSYALSEIVVAVEAGSEVTVAGLHALIEPLRQGVADLTLAPMQADLSGLGWPLRLAHRISAALHRRVWGAFALSDRGVARAFPLAARRSVAARLARVFPADAQRVVEGCPVRMQPLSLTPALLSQLFAGRRSAPVRPAPAQPRAKVRRVAPLGSPQTLMTEERTRQAG